MIIFAQLCYCIYYENYYNPFIMKNKKNNIYWICAAIAKHAHSDSAASTARIKQQRSLPSE